MAANPGQCRPLLIDGQQVLKRAEGNEGHAETPPQVEPGHVPFHEGEAAACAAASRSLLRWASASMPAGTSTPVTESPACASASAIRPVHQPNSNTGPPVACARRS